MKYSVNQIKIILGDSMPIDSVECIGCGNHSEAFCINDEIVIKLPKHRKASDCLKTEMRVLRGIEHKMPLDVPTVLFEGVFSEKDEEFVYFASTRLRGKKLSKSDFLTLEKRTKILNAEILAQFLYTLHNKKQILSIKRKDFVLLHGDFSLNHVLFNDQNIACGILDFGDSRVGKSKSDFVYLLDDEDGEEFGAEFGKMVLEKYESYCSQG